MRARRGERQAVRAAETAGIPFTLSTVSVCPIDEVAAAALAGGGQAGIKHVLRIIDAEMRIAMALTGRTRIDQIDGTCLVG